MTQFQPLSWLWTALLTWRLHACTKEGLCLRDACLCCHRTAAHATEQPSPCLSRPIPCLPLRYPALSAMLLLPCPLWPRNLERVVASPLVLLAPALVPALGYRTPKLGPGRLALALPALRMQLAQS